ncbi:lysylphosphatidylglycerol synthase transmembrane domain-containing protein [Sulfuricurvum sp.]|uniref:lysylphosphatidylglycerol synthase transmembrane domain-containing protein n=1 Tax=Sulfuricurvum sp. TaxID=2025608 RepID=UPI003C56DD14
MSAQRYKKWFFTVIKIILIVAIVRYLVLGIDWNSVRVSLAGYSAVFLAAGVLLIIANDAVQAIRWRFLTRLRCSFQASFESIVVGGLLNVILPAKLGEISRLIYLRNMYHYPVNYGVGAMVIERGADIFMVACFLAAGAGIVTGNTLLQGISALLVAVMIGTVFALKMKKGRVVRSVIARIPVRFLRIYSQKIIRSISRDFGANRTLMVLGYTLALRIVYFLTVAFFLKVVASFDLSWGEMFVIYLVSSIAWSIPLTPGGTGTFHAGMVLAMGWYGIAKEEALAVAVVFHLLLNLVPMVLAMAVIFYKDIPLMKMVRMEERNKDITMSEITIYEGKR